MPIILSLGLFGRCWTVSRRCLKRRWRAWCARVGAQGNTAEVFAALDRSYREPGRFYHNWEHVGECLEVLKQATTLAEDPSALEMALWYHDAVYDPRATDNEERSARLAREAAIGMGLGGEFGGRVADLILATRVGSDPASPAARGGDDTRLIRDVDLSILGTRRPRYRRYERDIRREYAWVPAAEFRRRRGALLQGLLSRKRLYATEPFRERYEARARENLRWSLRRLGFPGG